MNILFCDNPLNNKAADADYEDEFVAAKESVFTTHLFSFECLTQDKDAELAIHSQSVGALADFLFD